MSSKSIFNDLEEESNNLVRYKELKEELIDLLREDKAINSGDYRRTEFLLSEVSILLRNFESNNNIKSDTNLFKITTKDSVNLKFEPRKSCGGNSYTCKGAVLGVKKISDDSKWLFVKDGGCQGWIHIDNVEFDGEYKVKLKNRILNYVKRKLKK